MRRRSSIFNINRINTIIFYCYTCKTHNENVKYWKKFLDLEKVFEAGKSFYYILFYNYLRI